MGLLLLLVGLAGLSSRYWSRMAGIGRAGLFLSILGVAAALVGYILSTQVDASPWWETFFFGLTLVFIGLALFGVSCMRQKLFARWNNLPLLLSLPFPLAVLASLGLNSINGQPVPLPDALIFVLYLVPLLGIALIGYRLQSEAVLGQPAA